jgi:hypothetical protein
MSATGQEIVASTASFARSQLRQEHSPAPHQIEHIVARQHGGSDDIENLALACHRCNLHKGPNLGGIDPMTGEVRFCFTPGETGGRTTLFTGARMFRV